MCKTILGTIIFLFIFISCKNENSIQSIGETEYYFNEQLSSISKCADNTLLIGTETGDIISVQNNTRIPFDTKEDRIYKTQIEVSDSGRTYLWLAVRNSGIQKWEKIRNNDYQKIKIYTINIKQNHYSPYDFISINDTMYVASSQGLFSLDITDNKNQNLSLLYPSLDYFLKKDGTPFVIHNLVSYKDSILVGSTQDGVLWYDINTAQTTITKQGKHIKDVSIFDGITYAISGDSLFLINPKTKKNISTHKLSYKPQMYYQIKGVHYLIGSDRLALSKDLETFHEFKLKRPIPTNGRNIITSDSSNVFTYLLTEKSLFRLSNSIDVFRSSVSIKASCTNGSNIYYLTNRNDLFTQKIGENEAKWIYTFSQENQIQWMDIVDNELYLYNINNEYQKIKLSENWIKNSLFASLETIFKSEAKITTARLKSTEGKLLSYFGIQDGAITVDNKGNIDSISSLSNAYLTSMFAHRGSEHFYISTLNNGVHYVTSNQEIHQVPNTKNISFINDIIATDYHQSNLIILTNKSIISQNTQDTIQAKGYKKLIYVNDTLFYALPEFGLHKFVIHNNKVIDKGLSYQDIRFDKNSSFAIDNKLILISNVGALNIDIDNENEPSWVSFDKVSRINPFERFLLISLLLLFIFTTIIIVYKKRDSEVIEIRNSKEDLIKRLADIKQYYDILEESDSNEILFLEKRIDKLNLKKNKQKNTKKELENYSLQIGKLNRKVALRIHNKLEEQITTIEKINAFDKKTIVHKSIECLKNENIEPIKDQVKQNEKWLNEWSDIEENIKKRKIEISDYIEIEGVNKNLKKELITLEKDLIHIPLSSCIELNKKIEQRFKYIESSESLINIQNYIERISDFFKQKIEADPNLSFINEDIEDIKERIETESNLNILKQLSQTKNNYTLLQILENLKNEAYKYKEVYDKIVDDNNNQINKKFEKELSTYISNQTTHITNVINKLIEDFYNLLIKTDKEVLFDILKITNTEGQHAKVLALLIANFKIKRTLIPGMLGIYGNLNPVVSRLINDRIKGNKEILIQKQRADNFKSLFIYLTLKLTE